MTPGRRLGPFAIVGLMFVCLGLGGDGTVSGSRATDVTDPSRLEVSSIDLSSGSRDAIFSARNMVPGDALNAAITVANSGRRPITYTMSHGPVSAGGDALSAALILTIKTAGSSCPDYDGITLYDGPLDAAAFGSQGIGRLLPGASAEILCFRATLPLEAGNELQGAAATVRLSFGANSQDVR